MAPKRQKKQKGKGVMDVLKAIHSVVKDNKLISKGLGLIPHPLAQGAGWAASQAGYGRKKKKRAGATRSHGHYLTRIAHGAIQSLPQHRGSSLDVLTHPAGFVIGSSVKAPRAVPLHAPRAQVGLRGRGIFSDIGGGIGSIFGGLGGGLGSVAHGFFG